MDAAQRWRGTAASLLLAAAYSGLAASTRPFSAAAYLVVSLPAAGWLAAALLPRSRRAVAWLAPLDPVRPPRDGSAIPWIAVLAVLVASELASYLAGGSRAVHPTISSGLDALFRVEALKAAAFFGWLAAGTYVLRR